MVNLDVPSGALFSPCRQWRYVLHRRWGEDKWLMVIGLNPSTADETLNDPTVSRCINLAKREGFGGLLMMNAYAIRGTDPKILRMVKNPVGDENDYWIGEMVGIADKVILAWGNHGLPRQPRILEIVSGKELYCLGVTKLGAPRHPLYLSKDVQVVPFVDRK